MVLNGQQGAFSLVQVPRSTSRLVEVPSRDGSRTFILAEEAQWLRARGLGARVTNKDLLVFGPEGPEDNELRMENECVRHKALDLVGDLALAGCDLVGHFIAHKSGHRLNAELGKVLLCEGRIEEGLKKTA